MTWLGDQLSRIADDMPERDLATRAIAVHQRRRRNLLAFTAAAVVVVTMIAVTVAVRAVPSEPRAAARPSVHPSARPSAPLELPVIKVGLLPTVETASVFVAIAEGYFQEEGLTVEPMVITGGAAALPPTQNGRLDLTYTDYLTLFQANERGKDFKIVASLYLAVPGDVAVVVNPRSKIRTVRDLKGKVITTPNLRTFDHLTLTAALKRAGLKPRDVLIAEKPYPEMVHVLHKGQADAAVLPEPYLSVGRQSGRVRILADAIPKEFAALHTAGLATTHEWARENPRTLAAFKRALAKAKRLIASDPGQVRKVVPTYTKISAKTTDTLTFGSYPAEIDPNELQRVADLGEAFGWLDGSDGLLLALKP
ncbi:ABC transporter substrate-binding protein [Nonomuraea sp. NPDC048826]|uniref:ABC transporter substrate-binding protein n=1 Tax=Nonomuraea sp. NPDC048826 TaxID=3364347 RepID=UPI00371CC6E0